MHFITGKHIPRRSFLQGMGAMVGLPMLDAMVPAGRRSGSRRRPRASWRSRRCTASPAATVGRLAAPVRSGDGRPQLRAEAGQRAQLTRAVSGLPDDREQHGRADGRGVLSRGDRRRPLPLERRLPDPVASEADAGLGPARRCVDGPDPRARFGQDTALPSLQLCIEPTDKGGGCDYNYSCAYTDSISWASPDTPLPQVRNPRAVFDMLFGAGGSEAERSARGARTGASSTGSRVRSRT
jgi:hypothetical protein